MKFFRNSFFVVAVLWLMTGCSTRQGESMGSVGGELNDSQRFTLKDVNGKTISLNTELSKNKAVLLNFFATWCPPCQEEIPDLIQLQNRHAGEGFAILAVDVEESAQRVSPFVKRFKINYPVLLDEDARVSMAYGIVGVPTTFLIDSKGRVLGEYHAFTRKLVSDVEKALQ